MKRTIGWDKVLFLGTVAVAMVASASVARAEDGGHRGLGLGGFIGYSKASDAEDGTLHLGGDLSIRILANRLGGRLEIGYRKDELEVNGQRAGSVKSIPILFSVQFLPLGNYWISPFAIAGGSYWYQIFDFNDVEVDGGAVDASGSESSFGWHIGGGVDFNLGSFVTLTGDIRWVFLETDFEDLPEADSSGIWVTGGIKFFLG